MQTEPINNQPKHETKRDYINAINKKPKWDTPDSYAIKNGKISLIEDTYLANSDKVKNPQTSSNSKNSWAQ